MSKIITLARVVHCQRSPFDVYIGRTHRLFPQGSIWGNPFAIGPNCTRREAIQSYKNWLLTQPSLLIQLKLLEGKVLGCWCSPLACHGDVLVEMVNNRQSMAQEQQCLF